MKSKHLYIHIPFCKTICTYCDFTRFATKNFDCVVSKYMNNIFKQLESISFKFETIYIGGGTPNYLISSLLEKLFIILNNLRKDDKTEITIELNPEFVTEKQIELFNRYKINRLSIGVQSLNDNILKKINRLSSKKQIIKIINLIKSKYLYNFSLDFIYALPGMEISDVDDIISFINEYDITHVSFYCLEIKKGSFLGNINYNSDIDKEEKFLDYIIENINKKTKLKRYEISNFAKSKKYYSKHNISYWDMQNWYGIGYGSVSHIDGVYYITKGDLLNYSYYAENKDNINPELDILIMGLRKISGIDLRISRNKKAYEKYKEILMKNDLVYIKNNFLIVKNVDLLNNVLMELID